MAEEKKNTNFDAGAYKKALRELLREYKPKKEIRYDELTDKMVTPFHLDAEQMDNLIVRGRNRQKYRENRKANLVNAQPLGAYASCQNYAVNEA